MLCFRRNADFEVTLVLQMLKAKGGREIITVGNDLSPVVGQTGFTFQPNQTLAQAVNLPGAEALIIPGGPIRTQQPDGLTDLIHQLDAEKKLLAAICFGPQYLGRAGVLDNHCYTTSCSEDKIRSLQVTDPFPRKNCVEARVVCDENVITSKGSAFVDFAFAVAEYLEIYSGRNDEKANFYKEIMDR